VSARLLLSGEQMEVALLVLCLHRLGGSLTFTTQELLDVMLSFKSMPVTVENETITLKLRVKA